MDKMKLYEVTLIFADQYICLLHCKKLTVWKPVVLIAGQVWAHHCCAAWSEGVIQTDDYSLRFVDKAVFAGLSQVWLCFW